jgi:hypothetical protein
MVSHCIIGGRSPLTALSSEFRGIFGRFPSISWTAAFYRRPEEILKMRYSTHKPSILILVLSFSACAQGISTSELKGTIRDQAGAAVDNARVQVRHTATDAVRSVSSVASGMNQFLALPVGEYDLEVSKPEFATYTRTGIVLRVASNPTLDVILTLASRSERVTVEADAVMVETRVTGLGQVIDSRRILDLPLIGRNTTDLIALSGAATLSTNPQLNTSRNYPAAPITVAGGLGSAG